MNEKFAARWREGNFDEVLKDAALDDRVCAAVDVPFVRKNGCLLREPSIFQATHPDAFPDKTGYEAFINKIHVDDLVEEAAQSEYLDALVLQGAAAAVRLAQRLEGERGRFRVLLSLDTDLPTLTLRFFQRRPEEPWGPEDAQDFVLEEVLMIDVDPT